MDALDVFKSEVFRPLATLVLPGSVAVGPYIALTLHYNQSFADFWSNHPNYFTFAIAVVTLCVGFVLEDIGSRLESAVWDELIEHTTGVQVSDWRAYLRKSYKHDEEPIGQHYLRTILIRFKFELSFGFALMFAWFGLLWLEVVVLPRPWSQGSFAMYSFFHLALAAYLLWESYTGAWVLADTRHTLLNTEALVHARQTHAAALHGLRLVLALNSIAAIAIGVVFLLSPTRQLFLALPPQSAHDAFVRLIGAIGIALGLAFALLATANIQLVRTTSWALTAAHLLIVILLLLPHGRWRPSVLSLVILILASVFLVLYALVGFRRSPVKSTNTSPSPTG